MEFKVGKKNRPSTDTNNFFHSARLVVDGIVINECQEHWFQAHPSSCIHRDLENDVYTITLPMGFDSTFFPDARPFTFQECSKVYCYLELGTPENCGSLHSMRLIVKPAIPDARPPRFYMPHIFKTVFTGKQRSINILPPPDNNLCSVWVYSRYSGDIVVQAMANKETYPPTKTKKSVVREWKVVEFAGNQVADKIEVNCAYPRSFEDHFVVAFAVTRCESFPLPPKPETCHSCGAAIQT